MSINMETDYEALQHLTLNLKTSFLSLPGVLRNQVYEAVFRRPHGVVRPVVDKWSRHSRFKKTKKGSGHPLALAMTCHQINAECATTIFDLNTFEFRIFFDCHPVRRRLTAEDFSRFVEILGSRLKRVHVRTHNGHRDYLWRSCLSEPPFDVVAGGIRTIARQADYVKAAINIWFQVGNSGILVHCSLRLAPDTSKRDGTLSMEMLPWEPVSWRGFRTLPLELMKKEDDETVAFIGSLLTKSREIDGS